MVKKDNIRYCVVAFLDLQGFSTHLELSSDLRTNIGKKAIERLKKLERSLQILKTEEKKYPEYFPDKWEYKRINDSVIFTIDLPEALLPNIGWTNKNALSESEWKKFYGIEIGVDGENKFDEKYTKRRKEYTNSLTKFIGLTSRFHQLVNSEESRNHFPGAKTIISTGFRRIFKSIDGTEDPFSANFAFSNAYKAQENLKGGKLFLDNNIMEMLDADLHTSNIAKLACLIYNELPYSPLKISQEEPKKWAESAIVEIRLFQKKYFFRQVNPNPLSYLQFIDNLEKRRDIFGFILDSIKQLEIDTKIANGERFNILKVPFDLGRQIKKAK